MTVDGLDGHKDWGIRLTCPACGSVVARWLFNYAPDPETLEATAAGHIRVVHNGVTPLDRGATVVRDDVDVC